MFFAANKASASPAVNLRLRARRWGRQAAAVFALAGLLLAAAPLQAAESPEQTVEEVNAALLHVMKNAEELGFEGRHDYLTPVLEETFDLPAMAQIAVGRHWSNFSPEERAVLVERFTELSISTFASRFNGYSGQTWRVDGTREAPRGGLIVENRLVTDGKTIPIDYLVHERDGEWKILDVYLDGSISELALRRSEFTAVLKSNGVDGLLQQIAQQVDKLGAQGTSTN